jgi:hypothetical protein
MLRGSVGRDPRSRSHAVEQQDCSMLDFTSAKQSVAVDAARRLRRLKPSWVGDWTRGQLAGAGSNGVTMMSPTWRPLMARVKTRSNLSRRFSRRRQSPAESIASLERRLQVHLPLHRARRRSLGLCDLDLKELRGRWQNVFGKHAAEHLTPYLRFRIIAYWLQADRLGHAPSWADFITPTPELEFSLHTTAATQAISMGSLNLMPRARQHH